MRKVNSGLLLSIYNMVDSFINKISNGILLWQYELIKGKYHSNSSQATYRWTKIHKLK